MTEARSTTKEGGRSPGAVASRTPPRIMRFVHARGRAKLILALAVGCLLAWLWGRRAPSPPRRAPGGRAQVPPKTAITPVGSGASAARDDEPAPPAPEGGRAVGDAPSAASGIDGLVFDPFGPVSEMEIKLHGSSADPARSRSVASGVTDDDGRFAFELPAGEYDVLAGEAGICCTSVLRVPVRAGERTALRVELGGRQAGSCCRPVIPWRRPPSTSRRSRVRRAASCSPTDATACAAWCPGSATPWARSWRACRGTRGSRSRGGSGC